MGCAPSREKEIKAIEEEIASKEKTIADLQAAADKKTAMLRKLDEALILSVMPRTVEDIEQLDAKMKADPDMGKAWTDADEKALLANSDLVENLQSANEWIFDSFRLDELTGGFGLPKFAWWVFKENNLLVEFNIPSQKLFNFMRVIQAKYRPETYHNAIHAVDVAHALHFWMSRGALADSATSLQVLSALVAALCHDCGHPAKNNAFMINSQNRMAILYNDVSVLENMHLSLLFETYNADGCDFLSSINMQEWQSFRKQCVSMVLATDFGRHNEILSIAQERLKQGQLDLHKDADFDLAMKVGIKCADLRHCMMPHSMTQRTTALLMEEFWSQGDAEDEMGLPISPFMNRAKANLFKEQAGFYQFMIMPLMSVWTEILPVEAMVAMDYTKRNWETWQKKGAASSKASRGKGKAAVKKDQSKTGDTKK